MLRSEMLEILARRLSNRDVEDIYESALVEMEFVQRTVLERLPNQPWFLETDARLPLDAGSKFVEFPSNYNGLMTHGGIWLREAKLKNIEILIGTVEQQTQSEGSLDVVIVDNTYRGKILSHSPDRYYRFNGNLQDEGSDGVSLSGNETYIPTIVPSESGNAIKFVGTEVAQGGGLQGKSFADTTIIWTYRTDAGPTESIEIFDTNSTDYSDGSLRDTGLRVSVVGENFGIVIGGGTFNSANITTILTYNDVFANEERNDVHHCMLVLKERLDADPTNAEVNAAIEFWLDGQIIPLSSYTQSIQWDFPRGTFNDQDGTNFLEFGYYDGAGVAQTNIELDHWVFIDKALSPAEALELWNAHQGT